MWSVTTTLHIVHDVVQLLRQRIFLSGVHNRDQVLRQFSTADVALLTAVLRWDECVHVPTNELAIFCANTGNPRQFIQRRGRILRKHPDDRIAVIHDLATAP
jgi:DNA or RNA helicases of superfamily II